MYDEDDDYKRMCQGNLKIEDWCEQGSLMFLSLLKAISGGAWNISFLCVSLLKM